MENFEGNFKIGSWDNFGDILWDKIRNNFMLSFRNKSRDDFFCNLGGNFENNIGDIFKTFLGQF